MEAAVLNQTHMKPALSTFYLTIVTQTQIKLLTLLWTNAQIIVTETTHLKMSSFQINCDHFVVNTTKHKNHE